MRIVSTLGLALRRLGRRPVRSLLLLQGTIWGIAVAIFPTAVIEGTRAATLDEGRALGVDRVVVAADPTSAAAIELDASDLGFIEDRLREQGAADVTGAAVRVRRDLAPTESESGETGLRLTVLEVTPGGAAARGLELAAGRTLVADDPDSRCVVEAGVADAMGRNALTPGDTIVIGGTPRTVVGVFAPRSAQALRTSDLGFDLDHPLYARVAQKLLLAMGMPVTVDDGWKRSDACVHLPARDGVFEWLYVRVGDETTGSQAATWIRDAMVSRNKTVLTLYPVVLPMVMGSDVDRFGAVNTAMFLACLVMGAVVMANLGLLNTLTRSREIAIRRVEGATRLDIAGYFLGEGLILGVVGAVVGCALGIGLAQLRASLEPVSGFTWAFPYQHAAIACGVAILIGVLAALLPAQRASRQEPVRGLADD